MTLQADVCFLLDCTGSMSSWIDVVKKSVKSLESSIREEFSDGDLRFAFVGYTDYDVDEKDRITWIDFTRLANTDHYIGFCHKLLCN